MQGRKAGRGIARPAQTPKVRRHDGARKVGDTPRSGAASPLRRARAEPLALRLGRAAYRGPDYQAWAQPMPLAKLRVRGRHRMAETWGSGRIAPSTRPAGGTRVGTPCNLDLYGYLPYIGATRQMTENPAEGQPC